MINLRFLSVSGVNLYKCVFQYAGETAERQALNKSLGFKIPKNFERIYNGYKFHNDDVAG